MLDVHRPATILVVEDEVILRNWLAQELEENGFHVLEAGTGDEAVRLIGDSGVDLVFTDIRMPGAVDGIALTQWVRKERPDIKVIISSGFQVRIEGADAAVVKPYSISRVVETMRGLLGSRPFQDSVSKSDSGAPAVEEASLD
jgi:DNA-binding response OmpR family regulator